MAPLFVAHVIAAFSVTMGYEIQRILAEQRIGFIQTNVMI